MVMKNRSSLQATAKPKRTKAKVMASTVLHIRLVLGLMLIFPAQIYPERAEERKKLLKVYAEFEAHVNSQVEQVLMMIDKDSSEVAAAQGADGEFPIDTNVSSNDFEAELGELVGRVENVDEILNILLDVAVRSELIGTGSAKSTEVDTVVNGSITLSCSSSSIGGKPLDLCIWNSNFITKQYGQPIVITKGPPQQQQLYGMEYTAAGEAGNCDLRITSTQMAHQGTWVCLIVPTAGTAHLLVPVTNVLLHVSQSPLFIYFIENGKGVMAYSLNQKRTIEIVKHGDLNGIAFDFTGQRLYWCSNTVIFRATLVNGSSVPQVETLYTITTIGHIYGISFDWTTGNLYGSTQGGYIFVCGGNQSKGSLDCYTLLDNQRVVNGIAVNPNEGAMYWSGSDYVKRADMNGTSESIIIVKDKLGMVFGIAVDTATAGHGHFLRLFWANYEHGLIESIKLTKENATAGNSLVSEGWREEGVVETVVEVGIGTGTYGICLIGSRLFWSNANSKTLQTQIVAQADNNKHRETLYTGAAGIRHLISSPSGPNFRGGNKRNPCSTVQDCRGICVLKGDSYACATRKLSA